MTPDQERKMEALFLEFAGLSPHSKTLTTWQSRLKKAYRAGWQKSLELNATDSRKEEKKK